MELLFVEYFNSVDMLENVKHIFIILSGKGGVGKSTVSTRLAISFKEAGFKVGLLDVDLCGPSVPYLLNLEDQDVHQCEDGWVPVYADKEKNLAVMSIGFLLKSRNDSVVWRGPKKTAMIKQFLTGVCWDQIDYLIIDTPPGTSDEHITVMENLKQFNCDGAILITTPQAVAVEDVQKELTFCRKTCIPVIGIIENMSTFECPNCKECCNIFSSGGGEALASIANIPFLGRLPLDPEIGLCSEKEGCSSVLQHSSSRTFFQSLVSKLSLDKNCV